MTNFTVKFIKDNGSNKTPTIETFTNKTLTQLRNLFNKRKGISAKLFVNNKKISYKSGWLQILSNSTCR